ARASHRRRAPGAGAAWHPARGLRQLRRSPESVAGGARAGGGALLVTAAPGPAGRRARPAAQRAALGARRGPALAGRSADGRPGRGPRAGGPAHLRAVVHAGGAAVTPALSLGGAGAVRPPLAAGSRLHDRGRGEAVGLRADQDVTAARAGLSRPHGRRNALVPRLERGLGASGAVLSDAPSGAGVRLMSAAPRTILVVDDEALLRRVLERSLARQDRKSTRLNSSHRTISYA